MLPSSFSIPKVKVWALRLIPASGQRSGAKLKLECRVNDGKLFIYNNIDDSGCVCPARDELRGTKLTQFDRQSRCGWLRRWVKRGRLRLHERGRSRLHRHFGQMWMMLSAKPSLRFGNLPVDQPLGPPERSYTQPNPRFGNGCFRDSRSVSTPAPYLSYSWRPPRTRP